MHIHVLSKRIIIGCFFFSSRTIEMYPDIAYSFFKISLTCLFSIILSEQQLTF